MDPFCPSLTLIERQLLSSPADDAMDFGAVYSPAVPAPQTVDAGALLPSMVEESRRLLPEPRQNAPVTIAADRHPVQPQAPMEDLMSYFSTLVPNVPVYDIFGVLANKKGEQHVPQARRQELLSSQPTDDAHTVLNWFKSNMATVQQNNTARNVPISGNFDRVHICLDGTILPGARPAVNDNSYAARHPLSKRFVRHVDQSQGYVFNPEIIVPNNDVPSLYSSYPAGIPSNSGVPAPIPTPIARLTPASSSGDPPFPKLLRSDRTASNGIDISGNFGDGDGGHDGFGCCAGEGVAGGSDVGLLKNNNATSDPNSGLSPRRSTMDDAGTVTTRRSRRKHKQQQQQQLHEEQQQQEQLSVESDATEGTVSRMDHSYYSDGESSQDGMGYDKLIPDDVTFEELSKLFIYNQNEAAEKLGIGSTTLKKICRGLGLTRWPSRHLKSLIKLRDTLQNDAEITERFPENERHQALTEIEESLRGRDVSKFLKDFRQKVFKNTHTLKTKNGGVTKK